MDCIHENFLKEFNIEKKIKKWEKQYKNKKIVLYGCGLLFSKINELYNLKNLNIVAVCDTKFETNNPKSYLNYKTIKPSDLKSFDYDVLIFTVFDYLICLNNLNTFDLIDEKKEYRHLKELTFKEKCFNFIKKINIAIRYYIESKNIFKTIKYIFSCNYTEYNSKLNYIKVLKRLKNKEKIKIIFIVESNQKWIWQSVYDEFKKDNKFELLLVSLPLQSKLGVTIYPQQEDIDFFSKLKMPIIDGYDYNEKKCIDIEKLGADIIFYTHPWFVNDNGIPPSIISKFALTCAISYGFNVVESNLWGTTTPTIFCSNLWTMFAESKFHKPFYENATNLKHKDILLVTGYPKMDAYKLPINQSFEKLWKQSEGIRKPRIIYAPHHSIERNEGFCASNFAEHATFFLDFIKKHQEYDFLLKPHPLLKSKCISTGFMNENEYNEYINEWKSQPNANVYEHGNYYDIFKTSDLLITDCSSFLGEYFVSGKPIIFLQNKKRIPFNKLGKKLISAMYKIENIQEINNILQNIFSNNNDYMKFKREKLIKTCFITPQNTIANYIVKYIKNKIK